MKKNKNYIDIEKAEFPLEAISFNPVEWTGGTTTITTGAYSASSNLDLAKLVIYEDILSDLELCKTTKDVVNVIVKLQQKIVKLKK